MKTSVRVTGTRKSLAAVISDSPVRGADYPERGGRAAYAAYCGSSVTLPAWRELSEAQQAAWVEVARRAFHGWTGA